jgi:predicted TIM-barrel fold metal-dependent hydrolase
MLMGSRRDISRRCRGELDGAVIDAHAHVGVSLKAYAQGEYPYAQTVEGLAYRMRACGVDAAVVFPFTPELHFDLSKTPTGELVATDTPVSPAPYVAENRALMREVFDYCPELSDRFLPFVSVDPARSVAAQVDELNALADEYPVYGIKINPVLCQSKVGALLDAGAPLLDFAEARGLPLLIHTNPFETDAWSSTADVFRIIEARPGLRYCLAHCILFHRDYLERAGAADNIWVDTAAMKIQVELMTQLFASGEVSPGDCIDADYTDHCAVMRTLCDTYPDTIIWGTDSPAYAYICHRKQADGVYYDFKLKATYEDEAAALNALDTGLRATVGTANTLDFIFGRG